MMADKVESVAVVETTPDYGKPAPARGEFLGAESFGVCQFDQSVPAKNWTPLPFPSMSNRPGAELDADEDGE